MAKTRPLLLGLALFVLLPAPAALGHGGQFRGPGAPPPSGPGLGPAPVPRVITPGETWQTWWDLNRLSLLPGRDEMLQSGPVTTSGPDEVDLPGAWEARRRIAVQEQVVPFLLRLVDPKQKQRDEVRAAALIALGKITLDGASRTILVHYLRDPDSTVLVRESAALGIGLLCRSRPEHQLPAHRLDELRAELLRAVDDGAAELRVRAFAALSLALLGDQPSLRLAAEDGGFVARTLWSQLQADPQGPDLPVALLTALGHQPRASVPVSVLDGLRAIALGLRRPGPRWTDLERSHAVTALARLGSPGVDTILLELARNRKTADEVRRAAYLGAAHRATQVDTTVRVRLARGVAEALEKRRDPLTLGLGLVAAGRLLGADLEAASVEVLRATDIPKLLFHAAEKGSVGERGYGALAIALAARGARRSGAALPFLAKAKALMLDGLENGRGDDTVRAVYAVGLGLLEAEEGLEPLLEAVRDDGALPVLRGHAAVALGQIGRRKEEVRSALRTLLDQRRDVLLRMRAALGLAMVGDREVRDQLLDELESAGSEYHRSHVVIALGRLGDLATIQRLLDYAQDDQHTELARALAVVAVGLILDPEPRPSLGKLRRDANFPAATQVLYSAFAIF